MRKDTNENWPEEATKKTVANRESLGRDVAKHMYKIIKNTLVTYKDAFHSMFNVSDDDDDDDVGSEPQAVVRS